jgi:hypothetical protein
MDRNNYIEIHPTQAQVAKISYHHPSKYLNQNVSPQFQCLLFRIMLDLPEEERQKIKDLLFILEKNNVSESAYREPTVFCDGLPRTNLVSSMPGRY